MMGSHILNEVIEVQTLISIAMIWLVHLLILPLIVLAYKKRDYEVLFMSISKLIASTMYSTISLIKVDEIYLTEQSWLRLMLIFSLTELFFILLYLMDIDENTKSTYRLYYFGLAIIVLEPSPEEFLYTYSLMILSLGLFFLSVIYNRRLPRVYNSKLVFYGILYMIVAMGCILLGTNRMIMDQVWYTVDFNGISRALLSVSGFYLIQRKTNSDEAVEFFEIYSPKIKRKGMKIFKASNDEVAKLIRKNNQTRGFETQNLFAPKATNYRYTQ